VFFGITSARHEGRETGINTGFWLLRGTHSVFTSFGKILETLGAKICIRHRLSRRSQSIIVNSLPFEPRMLTHISNRPMLPQVLQDWRVAFIEACKSLYNRLGIVIYPARRL
jgi:hypothetical protein